MHKRLIIPSNAQWRQWSLPSKLTFVGTLASVFGIFLSVLFFLWPFVKVAGQPSINQQATQINALTTQEARIAIDAMMYEFPGVAPLRVRSITSPVNGVSAVAIDPPYREFPNVVLFRYDEGAQRWNRVLEGLSLGIQPEVSRILDIHTTGHAVDIGKLETVEQRQWLADHSLGSGRVIIQYDRFSHHHPSGRETYHIDKRNFQEIAKQLFSRAYRSYGDDTCTLYDMPELINVSLSHDSGRFRLTGRTLNNQEWTVTFTGIDGNGYLDHKVIEAESTALR